MTQQLTTEILNAALENLTSKRQQMDAQIAEIRRMLDGSRSISPNTHEEPVRQRTMSAAGRRAIAEAQRKRWAAQKAASEPGMAKSPKPKRKLSAAGRRNIVAALKKRWAAKRGESATTGKTSSRTAKKKATKKRSARAAAGTAA